MSAPAAALMRRLRVPALGVAAACLTLLVSSTGRPGAAGVAQPAASPQPTSGAWAFDNAALTSAQRITTGDPSVSIAIVDSGLDGALPEFSGRLLAGYDAVDETSNAADVFGHGTEVASVAARACARCSLLPVRVTGSDGTASVAKIAAGIVWAADHGARVINVSLVTERPSTELASAVAYAQREGALIVAAAGNDGLRSPGYPAALPGVISVEAATRSGLPYAFSNRGASVTLAAPGCAPASTYQGRHTSICGTSIAAPLVAGAAGLLASAHPNVTAGELAAFLEQGADRLGDTQYGRLDAARALMLLGSSG